MPFAFCQYEVRGMTPPCLRLMADNVQNVGDAQRAITMGRGLLIDGRACRTEVAKVNRKFDARRHSQDADQILSQALCTFQRSLAAQ